MPRDGETLVEPPVATWRCAARAFAVRTNRRADNRATLAAEWRARTRVALVGRSDHPIIVTGHQPELIHPGVWAKYVVAFRFAVATGGEWIDLVADNDAPRSPTISVPAVRDGAADVVPVRWTSAPTGVPYERITPGAGRPLEEFVREVRALGETWWDESLMPRITELWHSIGTRVSPAMFRAARRTVDGIVGIRGREIPISTAWGGPWLYDLLRSAREFATVYNSALSAHRIERGIRNRNHPMPDLLIATEGVELPVWAIRGSDRRQRLFVVERGGTISLFADNVPIADIPADDPLQAFHHEGPCDLDGWSLRPRALALTLWARLLLADFFVHGIGGAAYDRITDRIIAEYYGLEPPPVACVSATMTMDLPRTTTSSADVAGFRARLRDQRWNPQRHARRIADAEELTQRRELAVARADTLRQKHPHDRKARRDAFNEIRSASNLLHQRLKPSELELQAELRRLESEVAANRAALGREYFIGFHPPERIAELAGRLPAVDDFAV